MTEWESYRCVTCLRCYPPSLYISDEEILNLIDGECPICEEPLRGSSEECDPRGALQSAIKRARFNRYLEATGRGDLVESPA